MIHRLPLNEVLSAEILAAKAEHIRDFLLQEGIGADPNDLGRTEVSERQLKELLSELAQDVPD